MIDLIILDCEGVLVDSERLAVRIDVEGLGRLGWELTEEEVIGPATTVFDSMIELPGLIERLRADPLQEGVRSD